MAWKLSSPDGRLADQGVALEIDPPASAGHPVATAIIHEQDQQELEERTRARKRYRRGSCEAHRDAAAPSRIPSSSWRFREVGSPDTFQSQVAARVRKGHHDREGLASSGWPGPVRPTDSASSFTIAAATSACNCTELVALAIGAVITPGRPISQASATLAGVLRWDAATSSRAARNHVAALIEIFLHARRAGTHDREVLR